MKVYELVAAAIVEEGCHAVFGLLGDGNLSLWGALGRDRKVPIYSAWHEGAAMAMADAYARSCGEVGVATVTCGPGLTHAATSLISAVRHGTPLVLIAGALPSSDVAGNQQLDQRRFADACGAPFYTLTSPDSAAETVRAAFQAAREQSCAVVLDLPIDVQEMELRSDIAYTPASDQILPLPDAAAVDAVVELISAADRPVVIVGRGAMSSGARQAIVLLADRIGAALGTTLHAKGCFADHARDIGVVGGITRGATRRLLAQADLVIAIGATLGYHTTDKGTQLPRAKIVRVDVRPGGGELGPASTLHLRSDAQAAAIALSEALERRQIRKTGFSEVMRDDTFKPQPWPDWPVPADGMDPRRVMREVSKVLPPRAQVSCGIGHFWSFPLMYLDLPERGSLHSTHAFGAIGLGLPFGVGLHVASSDRPVLAIEGDGSLMQALPEFESIVRQKISLVVLIMNDGGYGAEAHKMAVKGLDGAMARWPSPDFVALAEVFGGKGVRVGSATDVAAAVAQGFAAGGLFVIDARISPTVLSDFYRKTLFGTPIE